MNIIGDIIKSYMIISGGIFLYYGFMNIFMCIYYAIPRLRVKMKRANGKIIVICETNMIEYDSIYNIKYNNIEHLNDMGYNIELVDKCENIEYHATIHNYQIEIAKISIPNDMSFDNNDVDKLINICKKYNINSEVYYNTSTMWALYCIKYRSVKYIKWWDIYDVE